MKERIERPRGISYRVRFFRKVGNDAGGQCKTTLDVIAIRAARSTERALSAAKQRFVRKHRLPTWEHLALGYETEEIRPT